MRRQKKAVAVLVVGAFVLAACGGGDDVAEPGGGGTEADTGTGDGGAATDVAFDVGVTEEPCPDAVDSNKGCIFLGIISDLTEGPFAPLAVPITDAQKAFWRRVNENGGIGDQFEVDVSRFVRDNKYNPEVHNQVYQEIKPEVLALAQTLGSPTTAAIIDDMRANDIVGVPASWTSLWLFEDVIIESGSTYCVESMNGLDWFAENESAPSTVMAVHFPGDYGDDGAAGAKLWADANGAEFTSVEQVPLGAGGTTAAAVDAIVQQDPDVVQLTLSPRETGEIVGGAVARGYGGRFLATSPSFNPALLQSAAKDAILNTLTPTGPWAGNFFSEDIEGIQAMREALGNVEGNEGYTSGWAWSYPMLAALEKAVELGDLTRAGLVEAVNSLSEVDYQGLVVEGAGDFSGGANEAAVRATTITQPSEANSSGLEVVESMFQGETAQNHEFGEQPCFEAVAIG